MVEEALSNSDNPVLVQLLTEILTNNKDMARDIAEIKSSVGMRFEALELRISAVEKALATPASRPENGQLHNEISALKRSVSELTGKNEDLENRSRRNNIILHGLLETVDETHDSLLSKLSELFQQSLGIQCPRIERLHRLGRARENHPRPVILKMLDFNDKLTLLKNGFKLTDSGLRLSDDFSPRVRGIRKKLWEASSQHRNNGSSVKIRFDHIFIDNIRYNWCDSTNSLVKISNRRNFSKTTCPASQSATA